ncbi:DUF5801 repeats-in-toxin domain-containing protein, partial [Roseibium sp.]|uniref:DUF5801 repeats-in-toxin domain-containing protein n=1 Tax=Roseibium sp. TaxID=1936156 RepID=UPI003D11066E
DDVSTLTITGTDVLVIEQTVTDADGDTATDTVDLGTGVFKVEDDGPSVSVSVTATTAYLDESVGTDGSQEDEPGNAAPDDEDGETDPFAAKNFGNMIGYATLVAALTVTTSAGADGLGSQTTSLTDASGGTYDGTATSLTLSETGQTIYLFTEDGLIVGRAGDNAIDAETGTVAFAIGIDGNDIEIAQYSALVHSDTTSHDDAVSLGDLVYVTSTVTDGDGDTATATSSSALQIVFEDDGPAVFFPEQGFLLNEAAATFTGALDFDMNIDDNVGSDQIGEVTFASALDGSDSGLTSGGVAIFYTLIDDDQTLIAYTGGAIPTATTDSGVVFYVEINQDGDLGTANDTYSVTMVGTVDGGQSTIGFQDGGYDAFGSNADWNGFVPNANGESLLSPIDNDSNDLLITPVGATSGTVNNNANEFGTGGGGGGQDIGAGEGLRLDYVIDLQGDPASGSGNYLDPTNRDHTFDGHYSVFAASATFSSGQNKVSTAELIVYEDPDGNSVVGDGVQDDITAIQIEHDGVLSTKISASGTYNINGQSYIVTMNADGNGSVEVKGITDDDLVRVFGDADGFNSFEINYVDGGADYDDTFSLSNFETSFVDPGQAVDVSLDLTLTDADGDTVDGTLAFSLLPPDPGTTVSVNGTYTLTGTELHAIGSDNNDTIDGNASDNILAGLDGIDILNGHGGDDTLYGGLGNDVLQGGTGSDRLVGGQGLDSLWGNVAGGPNDGVTDTFVIDDTTAVDIIGDFEASIDEIDLTALLDTVPAGTDPETGGYVRVVQDGADAQVQIDTDGGGDDYTTVVTLDNFTAVDETVKILFNDSNGDTQSTDV